MEIVRFNLSGDWQDIDQNIIEVAVGVMERGGSIVYPTDTVYGLGVDATNPESVRRLFKIKKRPEIKPVPIMVRDIEIAKKIAYINKEKEAVLNSVWPGPVTVILEKRSAYGLPKNLTAGLRTVGIRIAGSPFTKELMKNLDIPISCTSANFSGENSIASSFELLEIFKKAVLRPDLILDAGDLSENKPSAVIDLTTGKPRILRMGPGTKEDLFKILSSGSSQDN